MKLAVVLLVALFDALVVLLVKPVLLLLTGHTHHERRDWSDDDFDDPGVDVDE